jgi:hypothetical protein
MPVTNNSAGLKQRRRWSIEADQKNNHCGSHDRRGRVHHNTDRAVAGVAVYRMNVRHLHQSEDGQQGQAQERRPSKSARRLAVTRSRL